MLDQGVARRDSDQIDFILVSRNGRGSIRNCRAYPSADIGSDHQILLANLKLKLSNRGASKTRKIDTAKLQNGSVKHAYILAVQRRSGGRSWKRKCQHRTSSRKWRVDG